MDLFSTWYHSLNGGSAHCKVAVVTRLELKELKYLIPICWYRFSETYSSQKLARAVCRRFIRKIQKPLLRGSGMGDMRWVQNFSRKASREETTWMT